MAEQRTFLAFLALPLVRGKSLAGVPLVRQQGRFSVVDPFAAVLDMAAADIPKAEGRMPEVTVLTMAWAYTTERSVSVEVQVVAEGTVAPEASVLAAERKLETAAPLIETRTVVTAPGPAEKRGRPFSPLLLAGQLQQRRKDYLSLAPGRRVLSACTHC